MEKSSMKYWENCQESQRVRDLIKCGVLNDLDIEFVIISHKRPENVEHIDKLFPFDMWCISEEDSPNYKVSDERKIIHSNDILGLGKKRQWVLDNIKTDIVVQIDDDIKFVACMVGNRYRKINNSNNIFDIIYFNNHNAKEIGAKVCAFTQSNVDTRKFTATTPFSLNSWCECVVGVIGR